MYKILENHLPHTQYADIQQYACKSVVDTPKKQKNSLFGRISM
jgi:hypothetical protein